MGNQNGENENAHDRVTTCFDDGYKSETVVDARRDHDTIAYAFSDEMLNHENANGPRHVDVP